MRSAWPILIVLLAGCAAPSLRTPSLAPRAAEAIDPRVPVPDPPLSLVADPALAARLAALVEAAQAGDTAFAPVAEAARAAAASAGPRQSESWIAAQQALSALVAARGPVTRALADIDSLASERLRRLGGIAAADLRAIEAATARVAAIDARQAALVRALQARLA